MCAPPSRPTSRSGSPAPPSARRVSATLPAFYREAAARASALRGGRTPGDFFLALAYQRTWYGELLTGSEGERYVPFGPLQWEPTEFRRYADPAHRDITVVLDSFLAIDAALHSRARPDFSTGAFGPARQLGLDRGQSASIAEIFELLDGSGVREVCPTELVPPHRAFSGTPRMPTCCV